MSAGWVAAIAAAATAACVFAGWLGRMLWRTLRRTMHFLDDYFGQPDASPPRPGVMVRLGRLEEMVREIRAETRPNGGTSMRDEISRAASDVAEIKDNQARMKTQIDRRLPPQGRT